MKFDFFYNSRVETEFLTINDFRFNHAIVKWKGIKIKIIGNSCIKLKSSYFKSEIFQMINKICVPVIKAVIKCLIKSVQQISENYLFFKSA